eukprot:CAMPEP_0119545658 /NCGR_PEP_ID=MMETSP1352-20130426/348_1 /TAXON_ID=265584 /ORGANISM="Stauroneis constricta, Strain CCMP1120" /LENGTH=363 /DNA_ID=CAMNT_0007590237 /DNA_START=111 /DNA_END=1202 /DNA_ORIENTATION=+
MKFSLLALALAALTSVDSFAPSHINANSHRQPASGAISTSTSLHAIGVLAKKAKEATLRQYISNGIEDSVMAKYNDIKKALEDDAVDLADESAPRQLQDKLTKRRGTITLIAEYRRKMANGNMIAEKVFDPEVLSGEFREFGATGIAVMADERMGGCTNDDLKLFVEEQRRAHMEVPGPVSIINSDMIIDELQIAQSAAYGAVAVVLSYELLGEEETVKFMKAAQAVELESIVSVTSKEDAQKAIDAGARMIMVNNVDDAEERIAVIEGLNIPEGKAVTTIANIASRADQAFQEIEEVWACRDSGFNVAWVNDVLYKGGADAIEHPGAIIKSMAAKSSLKFASPMVKSGRGEGAREYLGDIMM